MRVVEPVTSDCLHAHGPSPQTFARHGALAAILAAVGVLGLAVLLAAAVFVIMGLIFSTEGWSSLMVITSGGR